MMNVIYILHESGMGGAVQSLLDMLAAAQERLNPIVIIPSRGIVEERLQQMNLVYYVIPYLSDYGQIGVHTQAEVDRVFNDNYRAALELQEIIKQEKIQLIHSNSSANSVGAMAALIAGIPHVWHIREFLEEDFDCEFLDKDLKRELFQCADKLISISDCVKNAYRHKYGIDSEHIYDGLEVKRFVMDESSDREENCFLLAGGLSRQKGQLDAIKAVNELAKSGINVRLYIVGEGNEQYRWILKQYIRIYGLEPYVHIDKFKKDLREYRKMCRYSITASRMEALGRVTIEALLAGCIVIGANTGGTAEIIGQDSARGYLYRQGDYRSLAEVMRHAMEQRSDHIRIRQAAQIYALENFNSKKYMEKVIEVYTEALQGRYKQDVPRKNNVLIKLQNRYIRRNEILINTYHVGMSDKNSELQVIIQRWLNVKLEKKNFDRVLHQRQIHSIAIYGMSYLGWCLYTELENSETEVSYIIDRAMRDGDEIFKVRRLGETLPRVDAVIVTVLGDTRNLCNVIKEQYNYPVYTMKQILDWCEE